MPEKYFSRRNLPWLLALSLFLFAFLLYRNTVPNGYTLDDATYYTHNKFVQQGIRGIPAILTKSLYYGFNRENDQIYRPLPVVCFAIEHALYGNNPHINHFFNVLLYALCCSLLFFLLRRLFAGSSLIIPYCITLLFAAHPVHTEVVATVKGLDEILAFLFSVLTLYFVVYYYDTKKTYFLALSLLSYPLCLFAKEHGLTLLGIIPITLYTFRSISVKKIVLLTLPFCSVALLYVAFRSTILDYFTFSQPLSCINNTLMAADNPADRLATAFLILGKYLRLIFIPYPLCWDSSYNQIPITTWADPGAIASLIACAGLLLYGIIGTLKKSRTAFGILFFLLSFSLSANLFIKIGVTLGERLLFAPLLGFCIAAVMTVSNTGLRYRKPLLSAIMVAVIPLYALITVDRNTDWRNNFTLFSHDISRNTASARAHNSLGNEYLQAGRLEKDLNKKTALVSRAIDEYQRSLAIYPGFQDSWFNLGNAYNEGNLKERALESYLRVIALRPKHAEALNNIGVMYFTKGAYDSAARYFQKAAAADTQDVTAYSNIGAVDYALKNYGASLECYEKVLRLDPQNITAYRRMGKLYTLMKDTATAVKCFATAVRLDSAGKR